MKVATAAIISAEVRILCVRRSMEGIGITSLDTSLECARYKDGPQKSWCRRHHCQLPGSRDGCSRKWIRLQKCHVHSGAQSLTRNTHGSNLQNRHRNSGHIKKDSHRNISQYGKYPVKTGLEGHARQPCFVPWRVLRLQDSPSHTARTGLSSYLNPSQVSRTNSVRDLLCTHQVDEVSTHQPLPPGCCQDEPGSD